MAAPGAVGGLERVLQGLALGLADRGHEVHVIAVLTPEPAEAPFCRAFVGRRVILHELRVPPGVRHYATERRQVRALLREIRPDVVHTHGFRSDILDGGLAQALGLPVVTTIHGESFMGGRTALYEWLQWRAYRRFDAVVAVSGPLERTALARGVPRDRLHLVPNAWPGGVSFLERAEARAELGLAPDARVAGWLARMIPVKGADVFLRALAEPASAGWSACLIGDGSEHEQLRAMVTELGLADRVRFAGAIEGGARYLRAFDAFVLSSRSEGTPIALFEAMVAGVPIVASRVGGVPDVLGEDAGWLVPAEAPAPLAAALQVIRDAPARATAAVQAASHRLESRYSTAAWLARHEAIYARLAAGRR